MNFTVTAYNKKVFKNQHGMKMHENELVKKVDCYTATQAHKKAKELYEQGVDSICINHLGGGDLAVRFWCPREGVTATAVNWVDEFDNGLEL